MNAGTIALKADGGQHQQQDRAGGAAERGGEREAQRAGALALSSRR